MPPQKGEFIDGEGVGLSEDEVDGLQWQYHRVWHRIAPSSCRRRQSVSGDGAESRERTWWMEWTRVG